MSVRLKTGVRENRVSLDTSKVNRLNVSHTDKTVKQRSKAGGMQDDMATKQTRAGQYLSLTIQFALLESKKATVKTNN